MSIDLHVAKLRELSKVLHLRAQRAALGDPIDLGGLTDATSDATRHTLAALEELERRVRLIEYERR